MNKFYTVVGLAAAVALIGPFAIGGLYLVGVL